jgi:hypothetical protein
MDGMKDFAMAYAMKKRAKKMARGGMVEEEAEYDPTQTPMPKDNMAADMEDEDMIARIMKKRKGYSKGGMVANDDEPIADDMPANYDDLALRDDLEQSYTAKNSGDELGSKLNQDEDMVGRIMKRRRG